MQVAKGYLTDVDKEIIVAMADYSLNVSSVARKLYVCRNSVVYHLERIERLTGLNPANFHDLNALLAQIHDATA